MSTETQKDRETERQRDRGRKRQGDNAGRQRDRGTERQRDREVMRDVLSGGHLVIRPPFRIIPPRVDSFLVGFGSICISRTTDREMSTER